MATSNKNFKVKNGLDVSGAATASSFVKTGGSAAQFLMADGSISENAGGSVEVSQTPPESPSEGDVWYNSTTGQTFVYYDSYWVENVTGQVGPQGPTGATGPAGQDSTVPGPQGPPGADGFIGADGAEGPPGPEGPEGPQGPAGADGLDGATGPEGPQGPAGVDGVDGAQGPEGPQGDTGLTGEQGPSGVISVSSPITNSGTSTEANIGIDLTNIAPIQSPTFTGTVVGAPADPDTDSNTAKNFGYVGLPQVILSSGNLTLSKTHAGKHIYVTGDSQTININFDSAVPFEIGTTIVIINANVTSYIQCATGGAVISLRLAGTTDSGNRTLAPYGMATLVKLGTDLWIASGNGLT